MNKSEKSGKMAYFGPKMGPFLGVWKKGQFLKKSKEGRSNHPKSGPFSGSVSEKTRKFPVFDQFLANFWSKSWNKFRERFPSFIHFFSNWNGFFQNVQKTTIFGHFWAVFDPFFGHFWTISYRTMKSVSTDSSIISILFKNYRFFHSTYPKNTVFCTFFVFSTFFRSGKFCENNKYLMYIRLILLVQKVAKTGPF